MASASPSSEVAARPGSLEARLRGLRRVYACAAGLLLLAATLPALASPPPAAQAAPASTLPQQLIIFYNARLALRAGRPTEVLKLWLLHNTAANNLGQAPVEDPAFRSVLWAALGDLGLCPDGVPRDEDAAGLWPLAFHNWIVHNMSRAEPPSQLAPFDAFAVGRQQRFISLFDVLSAEELRSVVFFRTSCLLATTAMMDAAGTPLADFRERRQAAVLLRHLLRLARTTLAAETVTHRAAIEARIFDLDLYLTDLAAREARRQARSTAREAKLSGVSAPAIQEMTRQGPSFVFAEDSEEAAILRRSLTWSASEWLSLSPPRRLFLFSQARKLVSDPAALHRLVLSVVDALAARGEGREAESWIAALDAAGDASVQERVWGGERGMRLLQLDRDTGFSERSVIALHRGVAYLAEGNLTEGLRSFAYALRHAEESREAAAVAGLSRRWLSYVVGRHETTPELVATLVALVSRQDFRIIIEDLVWRAALRADGASFALCARAVRGQSALTRRIARLQPLASGDLGAFQTRLEAGLAAEPHTALRFVRTLLDRIEGEEAAVRRVHASTLELLLAQLAPLVSATGSGAAVHAATELAARCQAILDGLVSLEAAEGVAVGEAEGIHALSPASELFAGSVRLAPTDPLPWPFTPPNVQAPSVFVPLALVPVEWRDPSGALVFGWTIGE